VYLVWMVNNMISDEKTKQNLFLAYKISELYLKSNVSTKIISEAVNIPLSTIKRSINTVGKRLNDYLRLLPQLGNKEELIRFQEAIDIRAKENKNDNKWMNIPTDLDLFQKEIDEIRELYVSTNPLISEEVKTRITNLRFDGESIRKISQETGVSLATIHAIVSNSSNKSKK